MSSDLGFEDQFEQLYGREVSFGAFARELGVGVRDLYALLEERGLRTSNIGPERVTIPVSEVGYE